LIIKKLKKLIFTGKIISAEEAFFTTPDFFLDRNILTCHGNFCQGKWGCSAVGSAHDWQSCGHGFESRHLHQTGRRLFSEEETAFFFW
jgi:hypothetical protein